MKPLFDYINELRRLSRVHGHVFKTGVEINGILLHISKLTNAKQQLRSLLFVAIQCLAPCTRTLEGLPTCLYAKLEPMECCDHCNVERDFEHIDKEEA